MRAKRLIMIIAAALCTAGCAWCQGLQFDPTARVEQELVMPDGRTVKYIAYEGIPYLLNGDAPQLQVLNFYVPHNKLKDQKMPILLRTYVGGYMQAQAQRPSPTDATGRGLKEGMAVCIPGSRGINTVINGKHIGTAPAGLLDLKAAVRYLHYNDAVMPGSAGKIVVDGTSAGGAMAALLGTTGNNSLYSAALSQMGAAPAGDDIYAAVCYCPITDLNHADMEYEWLFGVTNDGVRNLTDEQKVVSQQLSSMCPAYINSLGLTMSDGTPLTSVNYRAYLKQMLIASAERALQEGCPIPDSIGVKLYTARTVIPGSPEYVNPPMPLLPPPAPGPAPAPRPQPVSDGFTNMPVNPPGGGPGLQMPPQGSGLQPAQRPPRPRPMPVTPPMPQPILVYTPPQVVYTDYVGDIDLARYFEFMASFSPLKEPPAFDRYGVLDQGPTVENRLFGNVKGDPANFTDYSLRLRTGRANASVPAAEQQRIDMMNPMAFIGVSGSTMAPYWYIRHGALDTDTSFLVPINLAVKLENAGADVDFFIPWNRSHQGDYNLDDLFKWIKSVTR